MNSSLPETTAERKIRLAQANPKPRVKQIEIPGLDTVALSKKYQNPLRAWYMTFVAPIDMKPDQLIKEFQKALDKWVKYMEKSGKWEINWGHPLDVKRGIYPYRDLQTGKDDPGRVEYVVGAWFSKRHPTYMRIEVEPELLYPVVVGNRR